MTRLMGDGRRTFWEPSWWLSAVRRRVAARLLSGGTGSRAGLAGLSVVPKKLKMPLQRDGLEPIAALGQLRDSAPVAKISRVLGMNVWLVSGYEQARAVLSDAENYSTDIRSLTGPTAYQIGGLGFTDPPEHTQLRNLLTPEFTGRRLEALRPMIERIVNQTLDSIDAAGDGTGTVDLASSFAFPVPFLVICEFLGLPAEDRDRFQQLGRARFDVAAGGTSTFGAMSESREFLVEAVSKQRRHPGDGLIGTLIRSGADGIDDAALAGLADGVFTGGYETSASMLALGTLGLLQNRAAFELIGKDDEALDGIVEELLRYLSVVQVAFPRFARHDLTLFGKNIRAGDVLICSLSGANRDDIFGANPNRFDVERARRSHLAFGHGFHRCIGSELARMELRIAFSALARRFPDLTLAVEPSELTFRPLSIVYGVESLPVRLGACAPSTHAHETS